jgi:Ca2+-binding RTX toxin-like protein
MGKRIWAVVGTAVALAMLTPSVAAAGIVTGGDKIFFQAMTGETNNVVVDRAGQPPLDLAETAYLISDSGAPLQAGAGCVQVDAHSAICALDTTVRLVAGIDTSTMQINTGDRDDSVDIRVFVRMPTVNAGDGNDTVVSRGFGGSLSGGYGNDFLQALPFSGPAAPPTMALKGGPGDDTIYGSEGNDLIEGDTSVYSSPPSPIYEGSDTIHGGGGNDWITDFEKTSVNRNVYYGDAGNDFIGGGAGQDQFHGGDGADTITSKDGYDGSGASPAADAVDCGPSVDQVNADLLDSVAADCESVTRS